MPFGTPAAALTSIPPIQSGTTGEDMVSSINDRLRRITQLLGDQPAAPAGPPPPFEYAVPAGTLDGANKVFALPHAPNPPESLVLRLNGVVELQGSGGRATYTLSGNTITYKTAPDSNDWHFAGYSI